MILYAVLQILLFLLTVFIPDTVSIQSSSSSSSIATHLPRTTTTTTTTTKTKNEDRIITNATITTTTEETEILSKIDNNRTKTVMIKKKRKKTTITKKEKKRNPESVSSLSSSKNSIARDKNDDVVAGTGVKVVSKEATSLRRIKNEWKEAVKMGIAYDWVQMRNVEKKKKKKNDDDENNIKKEKSYSGYVRIGPFGKNLLAWHFSVLGPPNSEFENGIYHGRVLLPKDYPRSPPRIQVITPSGRFIPGHDICLSASAYHPESWSPKWRILSLIDGLRVHMITQANEIGGITATREERQKLAKESRCWSLGDIQHERMIRQGMFSIVEEETITAAIEEGNVVEKEIIEEHGLQWQQQQSNYEKGKLDILTRIRYNLLASPTRRFVTFFLLTLFILLNI